jgi:hypothetical protein
MTEVRSQISENRGQVSDTGFKGSRFSVQRLQKWFQVSGVRGQMTADRGQLTENMRYKMDSAFSLLFSVF